MARMATHHHFAAKGAIRPSLHMFTRTAARMLCLAASVSATAWVGGAHAQGGQQGMPAAASSSASGVVIEGAWIRATVKGQTATGGFMDLTSDKPMTLIGFETPVARSAEVHEMVMDGDIMRMHAIESLPLPAKTKVSFKPGSHHLMLLDLKRPLPAGQTVQLTVSFKDETGHVTKQQVSVPVKAMMPAHHH